MLRSEFAFPNLGACCTALRRTRKMSLARKIALSKTFPTVQVSTCWGLDNTAHWPCPACTPWGICRGGTRLRPRPAGWSRGLPVRFFRWLLARSLGFSAAPVTSAWGFWPAASGAPKLPAGLARASASDVSVRCSLAGRAPGLPFGLKIAPSKPFKMIPVSAS